MKLYQVTFEKHGIYQANVIETTDEESARKWYARHAPESVVIDVAPVTPSTLEKPGMPRIHDNEAAQEERNRENQKCCKRIADELEDIAAGYVYKCPECGAQIEAPGERCGQCGAEIDPDDAENITMYDYMDDVLDIEYIINSRREYIGARLYVTLGGPTVYVDTRDQMVRLYWGGERAERGLSCNTCDALDDVLREMWEADA